VTFPSALSVAAGFSSVVVSWQISTGSDELAPTAYQIELSTDGGLTWAVANSTGSGLSRVVTGLTNGRIYLFRVTAFAGNASATSVQSLPVVPFDPSSVVSPDTGQTFRKVTVGTFNGFIGIYTSGYEGSRMTARIAGRWIQVNRITNVPGRNFSLTRRATGAGIPVNVDVFIDGRLVSSARVITK
jgi:hypothetical protein